MIDKNIINEMSYTRTFAISRIANFEYQINLHVIKIIYINDPVNINHWRSEIFNWLRIISSIRIKPKAIPLERDIYFEQLYLGHYGHDELGGLTVYLEILENNGYSIDPNIDPNRSIYRIKTFFSKFSDMCAQGNVPRHDIVNLIMSI